MSSMLAAIHAATHGDDDANQAAAAQVPDAAAAAQQPARPPAAQQHSADVPSAREIYAARRSATDTAATSRPSGGNAASLTGSPASDVYAARREVARAAREQQSTDKGGHVRSQGAANRSTGSALPEAAEVYRQRRAATQQQEG